MEVGDKNAVDHWRSDIRIDKLTLGSLAWVEEEPFLIPPEEVSAVVAKAGGLLA